MPIGYRLALGIAAGTIAAAAYAYAASPSVITIADDKVFPESITSTKTGELIIGSYGKGAVYRAKAGSDQATMWLDPAKTGMVSIYGVFADDHANTLYVCSLAPTVPPGTPRQIQYVALRTFDLTTGAAKASYPMPDPEKAVCNDIDVGKDGTAYISDTRGGQVLRLKKGAPALETWIKDDRLVGVDGIALGDRMIYVNVVYTNRLFRIPITANGAAGDLAELQPSMTLARPDGMRSLGGNKFLMAENSDEVGRVTEVTVIGDKAEIKVLKVDPGVTAITKIGNTVWVNNAKAAYRGNGALKDQSPEPFVEYAIPFPPH